MNEDIITVFEPEEAVMTGLVDIVKTILYEITPVELQKI
jgi:hypothetical protein